MAEGEGLVDLLPTKATRITASTTLVLLLPAWATPHFLSPLWPKSTQVEIVLAQILLPALTLLVGSLLVLVLTLRYYRNGKASARPERPLPSVAKPSIVVEPIRQDPLADFILEALFRFPDKHARELAKPLEKPVELVKFHLENLHAAHLIEPSYATGGPYWSCTQMGRTYVLKHNLLEQMEPD